MLQVIQVFAHVFYDLTLKKGKIVFFPFLRSLIRTFLHVANPCIGCLYFKLCKELLVCWGSARVQHHFSVSNHHSHHHAHHHVRHHACNHAHHNGHHIHRNHHHHPHLHPHSHDPKYHDLPQQGLLRYTNLGLLHHPHQSGYWVSTTDRLINLIEFIMMKIFYIIILQPPVEITESPVSSLNLAMISSSTSSPSSRS